MAVQIVSTDEVTKLIVNGDGSINVDVSGTVTTTNPSVGATGAAVPADATLVGATDGTDLQALHVDGSGNLKVNVAAGGGSGGTSSSFSAAFPATGTAAGASDGTDMRPLLVDGSGFLKVNVAAGSSGNAAASATGSAVPADADYGGVNVAGTLRGQTGVNPTGSVYAAQTDLSSVGGASISIGQQAAAASLPVILPSATITTLTPPSASAIGTAVSTDLLIGTQVAGSSVPVALPTATITSLTPPTAAAIGTAVSGDLLIGTQVAGSSVPVALPTATISTLTPLSTVTSEVVGHAGVTLDAVLGATKPANVLQVGGNDGTNAYAIPLASGGGTVAVSGTVGIGSNQSVNLAQVNGVTTSTGAGATGTGTQRVGVAQDTSTVAGSAPGTAGSASSNVVTVQGIASMTKLLVTPDANSAVNVAQINGVTPLMGNGTTGTGSQRVTIASDNTAFSVNATVVPATSGGLSVVSGTIGATATAIKASAGQLYGWYLFNSNATIVYCQIFNIASGSVSLGSSTPALSFGIPAGAAANILGAIGIAFGTAMSFAFTTTRSGSTGPASTVDYNFFYD